LLNYYIYLQFIYIYLYIYLSKIITVQHINILNAFQNFLGKCFTISFCNFEPFREIFIIF